MDILVTCCNNNPGLFRIKDNDVIKLSSQELRGITKKSENFYICSHNDKNIKKLYLKNNLILNISDSINNDLHGLFFYKNKFYLADTYLDRIRIFDSGFDEINNFYFYEPYDIFDEKYKKIINYLDENEEVQEIFDYFHYNEIDNKLIIRNDYFHINDLFIYGDYVYYTMFRDWSNINTIKDKTQIGSGFLKRKKIDDFSYEMGETIISGLSQPHSPIIYNDELYVCNSRKMEVLKVENGITKCIIKTNGFTRGLCIDEENIYVGISKSIYRKSTKKSEQNLNTECMIKIYDKNSYEHKLDIVLEANEVYSIVNS